MGTMQINKYLLAEILRRSEIDLQDAFRLLANEPGYKDEAHKIAQAVETIQDIREDVCQS